MKESQIQDHVRKGWIRAIVTFEVVGTPKTHVEQALLEYLDNIKKDDRIIFLREESEPALEHDDGMFGTFCEAELLAKNLETFTWLCINFSPASIEILEPDELHISSRNITNWLNDLLALVHDVGIKHRSVQIATDHLTLAMNQMIKNSIMLSLKNGEKNVKEVGKSIGIDYGQIQPFLDDMVKKGFIQKQRDIYSLPGPAIISTPAISKTKKKSKVKK